MHTLRTLCALALVLGLSLVNCTRADDTPEPPPAGTFTGENLTLTLTRSGNDYTGTATMDGETFTLKGAFDPVKGLHGTFTADNEQYEWTAVVEGDVLKFETDGEVYRLALPREGNPLARKRHESTDSDAPKDAAAPAPSARTGAELKFTRFAVNDPGINNIEAVSFLIPEGWKPQGGVQWFPDYSILANLLMTVTDPESGAQIQFLPAQNFTWIDNPVVPMQPGQNYMGNIVYQPVHDVAQFIQTFYMPQALPHLQGTQPTSTEPLPTLARQISQSWGGQAQVEAARVRYDFDRGGTPWREDVYVALVFNSQQGMTIWTVNTAYSFRAPAARFDELTPRMATTISTVRLSPDWYAGYMYVQKLFMNRMNQGIQDAAAISRTITQNSEEIRRMFSDSYKQQCDSQDRISRSTSEYIRGVETYQNPYEDRPIQLPAGYTDVWVNRQGEYVLSPQSGYDPNVGSTVEWRRMEHAR